MNANSALARRPCPLAAFAVPAPEFTGDHVGRHILDDVRGEKAFYFPKYTGHHCANMHMAATRTLMNLNIGDALVRSIFRLVTCNMWKELSQAYPGALDRAFRLPE